MKNTNHGKNLTEILKDDKTIFIIQLIFFGLIAFGWMTVPDGKYCTAHYKDINAEMQVPLSLCKELHTQLKTGQIITNASELEIAGKLQVSGIKAVNENVELTRRNISISCPTCVCPIMPKEKQECPTCKRCPPCTQTQNTIKQCPQCPKTEICKGINTKTLHEIKNIRPTAENTAYQGGFWDAKQKILTIIGENTTTYRQAPKTGLYDAYYSTKQRICFEATDSTATRFKLNVSSWIPNKWNMTDQDDVIFTQLKYERNLSD